jgi:hypothetical protein
MTEFPIAIPIEVAIKPVSGSKMLFRKSSRTKLSRAFHQEAKVQENQFGVVKKM